MCLIKSVLSVLLQKRLLPPIQFGNGTNYVTDGGKGHIKIGTPLKILSSKTILETSHAVYEVILVCLTSIKNIVILDIEFLKII